MINFVGLLGTMSSMFGRKGQVILSVGYLGNAITKQGGMVVLTAREKNVAASVSRPSCHEQPNQFSEAYSRI
jgi:hypothetical protein